MKSRPSQRVTSVFIPRYPGESDVAYADRRARMLDALRGALADTLDMTTTRPTRRDRGPFRVE
jgi:hypothetical protein